MKINQTFIHTIKGIAIGLVLVAGISYVQAAWAPPAGAPSEANNAPAPINVGSENQYKEGWLLVGGTGTPISALDVSNGSDTAQAVADMALITKTSRFIQTAKFGDLLETGTSGKVNVVGSEAKVNIGYAEVGAFGVSGPEMFNVKGSIVSTELANEGAGIDITDKGSSVNNVWSTMLCADTNGKIVLCKDIDVPDVEVEDIPLSVSYTQSGLISEDSCTKSYTYTASATGADGSVFYEWRYSGYAADWTYYGSGSPITISFPKKVGSTYVTQVRLTGSSGDETNTAEALYSPITIPARPAGASC